MYNWEMMVKLLQKQNSRQSKKPVLFKKIDMTGGGLVLDRHSNNLGLNPLG